MQLSALLADRNGADAPRVIGDANAEIGGLAYDSRVIRSGELFAALDGTRDDGSRFVDDALARGAVAILGKPALAGREWPVPLVLDDNPRRRLALMAARFYPEQPETVVAVTGTNGKTSVSHYTRALWRQLGLKAASLGTLGLEADDMEPSPGLTTPEPVALHRQLSELARHGIDHLAIEASSHGLAQHRLDGLVIKAAAFTHISRDHYDYHGSYDRYFAAKRRLFAELLPEGGTAVLNADIPEFAALKADATRRGLNVIDYGYNAADLRLIDVRTTEGGLEIAGRFQGERTCLRIGVIGCFQVYNLLAAVGLALASGESLRALLKVLPALHAPRGRMELVARHPSGAPCVVDYAHTPDALISALTSLRPHVKGRLHVVFGCGGDRDPGKRVMMGQAAAHYADLAYVTDDNPRSEDPSSIRAQTLRGCPNAVDIGDRAEAIATAYRALKQGDILLVAGKGHETGQIVGDRVRPFDDAEVIRRLGDRGS